MRLVTYRMSDGTTAAARVEGDTLVLLPYRDIGELLTQEEWAELAKADGPHASYETERLAPLILTPPKIWCVGLNYPAHVAESTKPAPEHPMLFAKFAISLIGAADPIHLPAVSDKVDWEVELTAVIGRRGAGVSPTDALNYVAGYTVMNDVSMRDWQRRTPQYLQGKTFAAATPLGPELVTLDEAPDPLAGVLLSCSVNGEIVQSAKTDEMIFNIPDLVAYVSSIAPLEPGDVIATGTPSGIGATRTPPMFLKPGDVLETVVEGIGALRNVCVAEQ